MSLSGHIAIVTGGSRGIGFGIAKSLADLGARVAVVATTQAGADAAAQQIGGQGFAVNVAEFEAVASCMASIESAIGTPTILVNNAGITRDQLMLRMSEEDWDTVLAINLKGAFNCTKAVLKGMMKARYGRIVNVSSIVGVSGAAGQANYAASKAGLIGFSKSLAKEVGSRGITCNVVAPGFIETDMTHGLSDEMRESVTKSAPAGRLGSADDIANAVAFLASPGASYITGQTLIVDGGLSL